MSPLSRIVVLAAVSLTSAVVPATAQIPGEPAPLPAGDWGGGAIKVTKSRDVGKGNMLMSFHSSGDGRARMFATLRSTCVGATLRRTIDVGPDGSFAVKGRQTSKFALGPGRVVARYDISGRITPEGGSGTATARLTRREPGRRSKSCDTGRVDWTVRPGGDPAAAGAPAPAGARLYGFTSQRDARARDNQEALALTVTSSGDRVDAALFGFEVSCRKGRIKLDPSTFQATGKLRVKPDGTFRQVDKYRIKFADLVERGRIVFAGRFTASGAHGTISASSKHTDRKTKKVVDRCSSGPVTWSARP